MSHPDFNARRFQSKSGQEITLREAVESDAAALLAFVEAMAPALNIQPGEFWVKSVEQEADEIRAFADCPNSIFLVALTEGEIVATLTLASRDVRIGQGRAAERHVVSVGLSVSEAHRGDGVGRRLLEEAIEWARETKVITRIEISSYASNQRARQLYQSLGFELEGIKRQAIRRGDELIDIHMLALLLDGEKSGRAQGVAQ